MPNIDVLQLARIVIKLLLFAAIVVVIVSLADAVVGSDRSGLFGMLGGDSINHIRDGHGDTPLTALKWLFGTLNLSAGGDIMFQPPVYIMVRAVPLIAALFFIMLFWRLVNRVL